jgi:hypothetical protein
MRLPADVTMNFVIIAMVLRCLHRATAMRNNFA